MWVETDSATLGRERQSAQRRQIIVAQAHVERTPLHVQTVFGHTVSAAMQLGVGRW